RRPPGPGAGGAGPGWPGGGLRRASVRFGRGQIALGGGLRRGVRRAVAGGLLRGAALRSGARLPPAQPRLPPLAAAARRRDGGGALPRAAAGSGRPRGGLADRGRTVLPRRRLPGALPGCGGAVLAVALGPGLLPGGGGLLRLPLFLGVLLLAGPLLLGSLRALLGVGRGFHRDVPAGALGLLRRLRGGLPGLLSGGALLRLLRGGLPGSLLAGRRLNGLRLRALLRLRPLLRLLVRAAGSGLRPFHRFAAALRRSGRRLVGRLPDRRPGAGDRDRLQELEAVAPRHPVERQRRLGDRHPAGHVLDPDAVLAEPPVQPEQPPPAGGQ